VASLVIVVSAVQTNAQTDANERVTPATLIVMMTGVKKSICILSILIFAQCTTGVFSSACTYLIAIHKTDTGTPRIRIYFEY